LISLDGKGCGISNDGSGDRAEGEADYRRVVSIKNGSQSGAQTKPVAELAHQTFTEQMGPRKSDVLLLIVLNHLFTGDNILGIESLSRVLPARKDVI